MKAKASCIYCKAPAVRWCDFVLGFTDPDGDGLFSFDDGSEFVRCDAPLCAEHAVFQHNIHFSGKPPLGGNESVDYCHTHNRYDDNMRPITEGEAEQARYRHRCLAAGPLRAVAALAKETP
jgi:hypothetical protein